MTSDDGSESVIDASGVWDDKNSESNNNGSNNNDNPSGSTSGSIEQPGNGNENQDNSGDVSREDTLEDEISWGIPF